MDCNDRLIPRIEGLACGSFANGGVLTTPNSMLLQESQLLDRLILRLSKSESVDVAIAWIRRGKALDALLEFAKAHPQKVRVLCGVNGYLTEPQALSAIRSYCDLKIAYGTSGIKLHSKIFIFRESSSTRLWVGSANLTESAFSTNREVVAEVEDDGEGIALFERYWAEFDEPDDVWMDDYASAYALVASKPPAYPRQVGPPRKSQPIAPAWRDYVSALQRKNGARLDWIANQLGEVTAIALKDWQFISKQEAEKLLGIAKGYGGLGRLIGAGQVKNIFYDAKPRNLKIRQQIGDALNMIPADPSAQAFEPMVARAFDLVTGINRVSTATLTRLLALRRPDHFVSVNGQSRAGLSILTGISQKDLQTASGYVALTRWVMNQPWWPTPDPMDETTIYWKNRAALLDIFVYAGDNSKGMEAYSPANE